MSIIGLLLALGGGIFWRYERAAEPPSAARLVTPAALPLDLGPPTYSMRSIAVLPFVNMSSDPGNEYFSDGLSEELITLLARLPGWRVIARTSSFAYKGKNVKISDIARELKVANVLEGSVRKSGEKVRITAQLVRASDSTHLWSQTYDRTLDDIFAVQDDISAQVIRAVEAALLVADDLTQVATALKVPARGRPLDSSVTPSPRRPRNAEAYNLLLQGRFAAQRRRSHDDYERALRYLQQSLEQDPAYAPTWVELAKVHMLQSDDGWVPPAEGYARAHEAAEKALALDPNLAGAHSVQGSIHVVDWDWVAAEASFRKALALEPDNADALQRLGLLTADLGRADEGLSLIRKSIEIDPLGQFGHARLGYVLSGLGRHAEAEAAYRKIQELGGEPDSVSIGLSLLLQGKSDDALREIEREASENWRLYGLSLVYHTLGRRTDSDSALASLKAKYAHELPFFVAEVHAWRGENDLAFAWLDRAYAARDSYVCDIKLSSFFQRLAGDPRHKAFLRKLKLPE